jgi:hypothetical protein
MSAVVLGRPEPSEYAAYYEKYVSRVPEEDLAAALENDRRAIMELLRPIPESRAGHRYDPAKWSIREVVQHVVDSERVFGFRGFWFARNAGDSLPGFEQDDVMRSAPPGTPLADLVAELDHVRSGHVRFFRALDPEAGNRSGIASGNPVSVRAIAAIIVGHSRHHAAILRERYLSA